jgi:hypothetical protein
MFVVLISAILFTVAREQVGRVALVVFCIGTVEALLGLAAVMTLFQTVAAIGYAQSLSAYAEAIGATLIVLVVASGSMNGLLWIGIRILQLVV